MQFFTFFLPFFLLTTFLLKKTYCSSHVLTDGDKSQTLSSVVQQRILQDQSKGKKQDRDVYLNLSSQYLSDSLPEGDPAQYALPIFLEEPEDNFVVKSKPAELQCRVAHALSVHFQCNDEVQSQAVTENHVEPETGIRYTEARVEVTRDQVEEFFGDYHCACVAVSGQGALKSRLAYVTSAFLKKEFEVPPYSDQSIQGKQVELRCHPPKGKPEPLIYWLKNQKIIDEALDQNFIVTTEGHLIIVSARLEDTANYTCVAENIAAKRKSPAAELNIYASGGWSSWSSWSSCSVTCGQGLKRRSRVCNNLVLGLDAQTPCPGKTTQKKTCDTVCPGVDGNWSTWSTWSSCNQDCTKTRKRNCDRPAPKNGGHYCFGVNYDSRDCLGGLCGRTGVWVEPRITFEETEPGPNTSELALYIGLSLAVLVFIVVVLVAISLLRRRRLPGYSLTDSPSEGLKNKKVLGYDPDGFTEVTDSVCYGYNNYPDSNSNHSKTSYGKFPPSEHHYEQPMVRLPRQSPVDSIIKPLISDSSGSSTGGNISPRSPSTFDRSPGMLQSSTPVPRATASSLFSQSDPNFTKWSSVTSNGARLTLSESNITLTVPEGAVGPGKSEDLFLSVLHDRKLFPTLKEGQTLLSPVILCGPEASSNRKLKKPVILSFPHSASLRQGNWTLSVVQANLSEGDRDNLLQWRHSVTLGQETINCPLYTQLDLNTCHIVTDSLSAFALIGQSQGNSTAFKSLRIAAFAQGLSGRDLTVRLYCLQDTDHAIKYVSETEKQWGGKLLDKPVSALLNSGGQNMKLQLERLGEGWSVQAGAELQEVPFTHLWCNNNPSFHCSFTLRQCNSLSSQHTPSRSRLMMQVLVSQDGNNSKCNLKINTNISTVTHDEVQSQTKLRPISSGCSSSESYSTCDTEVFRLPSPTKETLSKMLDTPVSIGNDWRMLAERLSVHRYTQFFASQPSPTSALLDLWEARNRESSATTGLINILRGMGRFDAVHLLEQDLKL